MATIVNTHLLKTIGAEEREGKEMCLKILMTIEKSVGEIRARVEQLHATIDLPERITVQDAPQDGTYDAHRQQLRDGFADLQSVENDDDLYNFLTTKHDFLQGIPSATAIIRERGIPEDVDESFALSAQFEKLLSGLPPSSGWEYWKEWIRRLWHGEPSIAHTVSEIRKKLQECVGTYERFLFQLIDRTAPVILVTQKHHWLGVNAVLKKVVEELQEFQKYLHDPGSAQREELGNRLEQLQEDCAKADQRSWAIREKIELLEQEIAAEEATIAERREALESGRKRKPNGRQNGTQTVSVRAGANQLEAKREELKNARDAEKTTAKRQSQLDADIKALRAAMDAFDPTAVDPERTRAVRQSIEALTGSPIAIVLPTKEISEEFRERWSAAYEPLAQEAARTQARSLLPHLRDWVQKLLLIKLQTGKEAALEVGKDHERFEKVRAEKTKKILHALPQQSNGYSMELAKWLLLHEPDLRGRILHALKLEVDAMDIPLPPAIEVGSMKIKLSEPISARRKFALNIIGSAVYMAAKAEAKAEENEIFW